MQPPSSVSVCVKPEMIPTYLPAMPDAFPMFLDKRVYQGSSGKVYPLPFTDRICEIKQDRAWTAIWLENEYLRVMILPQIGGRIHAAIDKTNGYDLIYRQSVIKPALVGLAGPWISGGIEFNWPQHHRPATFLPADFHIENHADGSVTVWLSDHDPMARMKGMHGVCLHPGEAVIELKVRAYNRTPMVQSFLWWANVATRVHEAYQSFFPPDVHYVADHARRAMSEYPLCHGFYYGVNYGQRGRAGVPTEQHPAQFLPNHCGGKAPVNYVPNDLSWYANIPVPTSYMCMGSKQDFFGGYDHAKQAGIVHIANHHISPGKKQWTWGNHEFGYAWDRNLTDSDGPYIELMAGVYTDNQPDFSFLQPGETKTWSQFWKPIREIGPACAANREAAVSLHVEHRKVRIGVCVSKKYPRAKVILQAKSRKLAQFRCDLTPDKPFVEEISLSSRVLEKNLELKVVGSTGKEIICFQPPAHDEAPAPRPASEPLPPEQIASADELYITGLHLLQYRHATRCPTLYWREALRRDGDDSRSNNAMGLWHMRRGEFAVAESHFRRAIARLTERNPNPADGEPFYNLGLCLRYQLDALDPVRSSDHAKKLIEEAYEAFYKATWNQAWAAAGYHALAEMDCRRDWIGGDLSTALEHLDQSLRFDSDNLRARDLKAMVLGKLGRGDEAQRLVAATLALDPLDWWALRLSGQPLTCDAQTCLDLAHDHARAGMVDEAIDILRKAVESADSNGAGPGSSSGADLLPTQSWGAMPMVDYTLGWLYERTGRPALADKCRQRASSRPSDYCFPARVEEIAILETARKRRPKDAAAPCYLGNLLYDRHRREEAIAQWERAVRLDPANALAWRNLGIGYFNVSKNPQKARAAYQRAVLANPTSARLLFERDQLWKRLGLAPAKRLAQLEQHLDLVHERDDLTVEFCCLYNQIGKHAKALELLAARKFQPWEGGEGQAMGQHVRGHLALGREALEKGDAAGACEHFKAAAAAPTHLGEARHLLANQSDIHYWLGCALAARGAKQEAIQQWQAAAAFRGDFQEMKVRAFSEMTYYSALSWRRLGQENKARTLLTELLDYAGELGRAPATIDYFATSLPTMLLFDDDLLARQQTTALFMQAQARLGLGQKAAARALLAKVLKRDPNHPLAADLLAAEGGSAHA